MSKRAAYHQGKCLFEMDRPAFPMKQTARPLVDVLKCGSEAQIALIFMAQVSMILSLFPFQNDGLDRRGLHGLGFQIKSQHAFPNIFSRKNL